MPAGPAEFETEQFRPPASLAPSLVPEPPIQESWLRESARALAPSGEGGGFIPYLFAIFLAALIAFVIVVELPKILSFVSKQRAAANSFVERFDGDVLRTLSGPRNTASEPNTASDPKVADAAHLDIAPSRADREVAATNPATNTPDLREPPGKPAEPIVAAPAPQHSQPAPSLSADPAPAAAAPPVASVAPSAAPVQIEVVKTVPLKPEKPVRPLGSEEIETLLNQGKEFVNIGDFASARMVFERVADAHEARGAMALAATYDPNVLSKIGATGVKPDLAKARQWYAKARDLGLHDAALRLDVLAVGKQ
jgi:cell wall-associated NlpC family hydrolase